MMNKFFLVSLIFFVGIASGFSQIYDPVSFETTLEQASENQYQVKIKASIEEGWHLYSQNVPEGGPVPTSIRFQKNENYELVGEVKEPEGHTVDDPVFEMQIKFFENEAVFLQKIKRMSLQEFTINGAVEFMVCNDESCLPPTEKAFRVTLPQSKVQKTKSLAEPEKEATQAKTAAKNVQDSTQTPGVQEDEIDEEAEEEKTILQDTANNPKKENAAALADTINEVANGLAEDVEVSTKTETDESLLGIFLLSFLGGLAALLTPCVFPMIPLTVSFFTKQSKNKAVGVRNALFYGLCIVVIYVILGSVVTLIFGADSLNALSTNVWFNLIFFILLVVFAVSFLGAFEIVLPSSWGNKMDAKANRGGVIGIFFMALALAIVSFSCTGPIVGTLLVQAASKGGLAPTIGMLGFSLAIAIPFALFAAFPGWLNSLPRSGGWLNTVKAVLGFLELALAFKFLSNADLVLQLHLLERETFLAIWIAIFAALGLYLFGKIKLPHDGPLEYISVGRLSLGIFVLAFTIYLIPGLWGAPLQWISGFPPPKQYSESPYGVGNAKGGTVGVAVQLPEGAELGPHDILVFRDYDTGMAYASKEDKPVLLDFTGYACVNCRKMEERVWPDPEVLEVLKNEVVLISLYVDDKKELPESEKYVSENTGKEIETVGNKWSDFQIRKYKANAQPYYVLIDNDGNNLNAPTAYDPNIDSYLAWLRKGIEQYSQE